MPKLLLFVPCEKVIIANDNSVSLITLFEQLQINLPVSAKVEAGAGMPLLWSVFTFWHSEPSDEGKKFEQRVEVSLPGNVVIKTNPSQLEFVNTNRHRVIDRIVGLPIVPAGMAYITLFLREVTEPIWQEI